MGKMKQYNIDGTGRDTYIGYKTHPVLLGTTAEVSVTRRARDPANPHSWDH
jgi:hypothetical protein